MEYFTARSFYNICCVYEYKKQECNTMGKDPSNESSIRYAFGLHRLSFSQKTQICSQGDVIRFPLFPASHIKNRRDWPKQFHQNIKICCTRSPFATRAETSMSRSIETTDLVITMTFSSPMTMTIYGKISLKVTLNGIDFYDYLITDSLNDDRKADDTHKGIEKILYIGKSREK